MGMAASAVRGNHSHTTWKHIVIVVTTVLLFSAPSGQTVLLVCQSYNGDPPQWGPPQRACTEKWLQEVVTIDLHYMTDRQEQFDLKISKLKILWKQRHLHLGCPGVCAQCRILRCNSDFVAATLEMGIIGGGGKEGANAGYCSALRSYALCTQRTARACRGDLAYHSAVQGIEDLLIQHRCPKTGPTAQPQPRPLPPLSGDECFYEKGFIQREGRAPEYLHCGVFGDPHIRTFNDDFQTCTVQGAWPLIDNQYLYIQATSTLTRGSPYTTTILTEITVILKNWRECAEQQIYQAVVDNVPPAFVDGSVTSGDRRGHQSLRIHSHDPGRHAEIWATHIGTTLVVRQVGQSLSLSVRSPRAIVESFTPEQDLQLCVWGCPVSQRLKIPQAHPSSPAYSHCSSLLPVRDVYFQACLFDLQVTGDVNSSESAVAALEDARAMISDPNRVHLVTDRAGTNPPSLPVVLALSVLTETLRHTVLGPV